MYEICVVANITDFRILVLLRSGEVTGVPFLTSS